MFTSFCFPFKLAAYKKTLSSKRNRATLIAGCDCLHFPPVIIAGSLFENELVLAEKTTEGDFAIDDLVITCDNKEMEISEFIEDFKESVGIDLVIMSLPVHFLITRQPDNKVRIFATNASNFVEMFAEPEKIFGSYEEKTISYESYFEITDLSPTNDSDSDHYTVIDGTIPNEDFGHGKSIKIGWLRGDTIEFRRYRLEESSNERLCEIFDMIENKSAVDFVEFNGVCQIGGVRDSDGSMQWLVEVSSEPGKEDAYIKEVNALLMNFMACAEDQESSSEQTEE